MIIFDTSTLILLTKKELLDIFLDNYDDDILIPEAVEIESCIKKTLDGLIIEKRIEEGKIKVCKVKNKELIRRLVEDFKLGSGESEAIVLCIERKAQIVATDDKNAINACKLLKIRFTTAINILIRLCEKNMFKKEKGSRKIENLKLVGRYKNEIIENAKRKVIGCKQQ